ncbi:MAG: B12-binding domain-containing radical SAM protein [Candidatus Aminicenantia bacterium]
MKVLLFIPPGGYFAERWRKGSLMPPLGLLYIGAVLEKEGFDVEIIPSEVLDLNWKEIEKIIIDRKPRIVGVTTTTENRFQSFELARRAKEVLPETLTVLGGPHVSMAPDDTLRNLLFVDVVVRGEGEETMVDILKATENGGRENLKYIPGISYRDNSMIIHNPPRLPIKNLDSLPFPARHLIPHEKYNFYMDVPGEGRLPACNLMTSRGCPFNCNFCATPINWGRAVRGMSPERVIEEIELCVENYGAKAIWFYDDTFNYNPRRVEAICDGIIKRGLKIKWTCELRIDILTKELLQKMKSAGLYYVSFGLEAGSERVRKKIIGKNIELKDLKNAVTWCKELEIKVNCFFIFSHPTETWDEAKETIEIIEALKDDCEISISILHIYPGTPLEKWAKEHGQLPEDFSWTKKRDKRVIILPTAQGHVPLFKDKLKWWQISELIFRWSEAKGGIKYLQKIPEVLKSVNSIKDLIRYFIMFLVFIKVKIWKICKK